MERSMKFLSVLLFLLAWIPGVLTAQQAPHFSQFTFNKLNFNPALVGAYEALTVSGFYRHQWFGVEGAPRTGMANIIAPLTRHNTVLGMSISYDQIGMSQTGQATASYTYVVRLQNGIQVLGGLSGTLEYGRVDWSQADPANPVDALIGEGGVNAWKPNFGAGLAINTNSWYLGISMPRFMKNHMFRGGSGDLSSAAYRELYVMGGLDFRVSRQIRFRPGLLMTYNPSAPMDMALDASLLLMNQFIVGAAYRLDDAITGFFQYRLNPQWKMGFAYDFTVSRLNRYSNGTAEIMLEYTLDKVQDGTRHIRFF
jgi:type IX secretion system PorP/SprF family membrane protein